MSFDFDFVKESDIEEKETDTSGNPASTPNAVTPEMVAEAMELAGSPKGLDIAAFQRKHNIQVMNIDEILQGI